MGSKKEVLQVLRELEQISSREKLPSIGPIKGEIISAVIKKYKPTKILEVGTLHGYSAILMANSLSDDDNTKKMDVRLITIEIDKNLVNISRTNIEKAGLANKIQVISGNALEVIPTLTNYKFDLIFLDAVKNEYLKYLRLIEDKNLLESSAVVIADNVLLYENEMQDYLDYVRNAGRYVSQTTETTLEFTKNVKDALEISLLMK